MRTILTRNYDETARDFLLRRLAQGPIKNGAWPATGANLRTLRAMRKTGEVDHEYDDRGDLAWKLK